MSESIAHQPHAHAEVLTGPNAEQELSGMGLAVAPLSRACVEGLRTAVNQHSSFEPNIALGFSIWAKIVGSLRTLLDERGWRSHDTANAPRSVNPDGTMAIAAIGGDESTACASSDPSNAHARRKGSTFDAEVKNNGEGSSAPGFTQPCLDLALGDLGDDGTRSNGLRTWMLLYFWDRRADELRLELSLPIACEDGVVTRWKTRIILPAQDLSSHDDLRSNDDVPSPPAQDVDFEITAIS
jgi:hypothetical protein